MSESELQTRIRLAIGRVPHARLFRNTVGQAWAGKVVRHDPQSRMLTLADAYRVTFGLFPGSSDLVGWTSLTVEPAMVGTKVALFTSGEVKTERGRFEPGQREWLEAITAAGGLAAVLRSEDDARKLVRAVATAETADTRPDPPELVELMASRMAKVRAA
jgi:hypothetical protein